MTIAIHHLFSPDSALRPFALSNTSDIPEFGSIIYTVFLDQSEFIYVGIGGLRGETVQQRNLRSRIRQHTSGLRSGDQFCIYIQDFYVIPELIGSGCKPQKGYLDKLTKQFIQNRLTYRFLVVQTDDSDKLARQIEKEIQLGMHSATKPVLNGLGK